MKTVKASSVMANQPFDVSWRPAGGNLIRLGAGEHPIDANYQTMGNGHQRPFVTESRMELPVSRFEPEFLVRKADQAASTTAVFICGLPFSDGARLRMPALWLLPRARPDHETKLRRARKLLHLGSRFSQNHRRRCSLKAGQALQ